ncbi:CARDB domain-containing protein [Halomontanus rarus]|uniref:CARDB domain-containing protein n=1 Tax=Halomontanus rarus TaxID=3034020 RepID=UPI0023E7B6F6|nr:CARDB domain-containing protein [Halovivax sp. TS33]
MRREVAVAAVLAGLCLCLGFVVAGAALSPTAPVCAEVGYDQTEDGALAVQNVSQLQCIEENDLEGEYALIDDIDASATDGWNDGDGFDPIGSWGEPFAGTFEGNGHAIDGLTIDRPGEDEVGLFSLADRATIANVSVTNATVDGGVRTGVVVGSLELSGSSAASTVRNVSATGSVSGTNSVGGLVGGASDFYANPSEILESDANVTVSGETRVGGVVGENRNSVVDDTHASGNVTGESEVGGLVGYNDYGVALVRDSSASGVVEGDTRVGGLIGKHRNGVTERSWATGAVDGSSEVGGLAGAVGEGTVRTVFATGAVNGSSRVGGLVGWHDDGSSANDERESTITDSYATGSVDGDDRVGGLIGQNNDTVDTAYATGPVDGTDTELTGGLVGVDYADVNDSYWDLQGTGQSTSDGGTGLETDDLRGASARSTLAFDFDETWIALDDAAPVLDWEITDFEFSLGATSLTAGDTTQATVEAVRFDDSAESATTTAVYETSDDRVLEADTGTIGALEAGSATLSATLGIWNESVDVTVSGPAAYAVAVEETNAPVIESDDLEVEAFVQNVGTENGTQTVSVAIEDGDGQVFTDERTLALDAGTSETVSFAWPTDGVDTGVYTATVASENETASEDVAVRAESTLEGEIVDRSSGDPLAGATVSVAGTDYETTTDGDGNYTLAVPTDELDVLAEADGYHANESTVDLSETTAHDASLFTQPSAGSGTEADPYLITDSTELQGMAGDRSAHYALGEPIDASDVGEFDPIGSESEPFEGSLDGQFETIHDLSIDEPATSNVGLFGVLGSDATVENVRLENATVTGGEDVGGLVGRSDGATITNATVEGAIAGNRKVAGLVGLNDGTIERSGAIDISVEAHDYNVGGLIGRNDGTVTDSYATGSVDAPESDYVGGFVGYHTGTISTSYAAATVEANQAPSGFIGSAAHGPTTDNSYWDVDRSDIQFSNGGTGLETEDVTGLDALESLEEFDFPNAWVPTADGPRLAHEDVDSIDGLVVTSIETTGPIHGGDTLEVTATVTNLDPAPLTDDLELTVEGDALELEESTTIDPLEPGETETRTFEWETTADAGGTYDVTFSTSAHERTEPVAVREGEGTEADPYRIRDVTQLQTMADDPSANYTLEESVDASDVDSFEPVGTSSEPFEGSFDGQFETIHGLSIDDPTTSNVSLFGVLGSDATVENVRLENVTVAGGDNVGGLAGYSDGATVTNATVEGAVAGNRKVAGLVGLNNGTIERSGAIDISVESDHYDVGGLTGRNDGTVVDSYATGSVDAAEAMHVGGLTGYHNGHISTSYAAVSVEGDRSVGGLTGIAYQSTTEDSYWDVTESGLDTSPAGTGLETEDVTGANVVYSLAGFDFGDTWVATADESRLAHEDVDALSGLVPSITSVEPVQGGETLAVNATVTNLESTSRDGDLAVTITNDAGETVFEGDESVTDLPPHEFTSVDLEWETAADDVGSYTVTAATADSETAATVDVFDAIPIVEPTTIDESGEYVLADDLSSSETAIEITADDVTLDGNGHSVVGNSPGEYEDGIGVSGGSNVTVTNLTVSGWDARNEYTTEFGLLFDSVDGGTVSNVTATGNGDGLVFSGGSENTLVGSTAVENNDSGVVFYGTSNTTVTSLNASSNGEHGLFLDGANDNTVTSLNASSNGERGLYLQDADDNSITSLNASSNGDRGLYLNSADNTTVTQSEFRGNDDEGLEVRTSRNNTISEAVAIGNAAGFEVSEAIDTSFSDVRAANNEFGEIEIAGENTSVDRLDIGDSTAENTTISFEGDAIETDELDSDSPATENPDTQSLGRIASGDVADLRSFEMHYDDADITDIVEEDVRLWAYHGTNETWTELETSTVDPDANVVSVGEVGGVDAIGAFRALEPANVTVDAIEGNEPVEGETLEIDVTVTNTGEIETQETVTLDLDGVGELGSESVTLGWGETEAVTFEWETAADDGGEYAATVDVADETATDTVGVDYVLDGSVTLAGTDRPVQGATLEIGDTTETATTDGNGVFNTSVPAAETEVALEVSAPGFANATRELTFPDDGPGTTVALEPEFDGSGTETDPFLVENAVQLQAIAANLTADYALADDIDAAETVTWNDGEGFDPIGSESEPFTGSFDGTTAAIANLTIDRPDENGVGLFGQVGSQARVTNVTLDGLDLEGGGNGGNGVGGLVGVNHGAISASTVNGSVTGDRYVGGLVGTNHGTISTSAASGTVTADRYVGGFAGENRAEGTLSSSYADATVSYRSTAETSYLDGGGFVGETVGDVDDSYAAGSVNGTFAENTYVGGFAGVVDSEAEISASYWDVEASALSDGAGSGSAEADGLEGLTTDELTGYTAVLSAQNLDFADAWRATEEYPRLVHEDADALEGARILDVSAPAQIGTGQPLTVDVELVTLETTADERIGLTIDDGTTQYETDEPLGIGPGETGTVEFTVDAADTAVGEYTLTVTPPGDQRTIPLEVFSSAPVSEPETIDESGAYELTDDLSSEEAALEIAADDVVLDGMGYAITGDDPTTDADGILVDGADNVTVTNVTVDGWNASDGHGIRVANASNVTLEDVTASANAVGIGFSDTRNGAVRDSEAVDNANGIRVADADETTLETVTASDNDGWDVDSNDSAVTADGLNLGESTAENTTVSFEARNVSLGGVESPPTTDESTLESTGRYLEAEDATDDGYLDLVIEYDPSIVRDDSQPVVLRRHDGDTWSEVSGSDYDNEIGVVSANVTSFSTVGAFVDHEAFIGGARTIDEPGGYELVSDVSSEETALEITADDVVLDGMGYAVIGDDATSEAGIHVTGDNVTVANLSLEGWGGDLFELGQGVRYENADAGTIRDVTVTGTFEAGKPPGERAIELVGSTNTTIEAVSVTESSEALYLDAGSHGNAILESAITDSNFGIRVVGDSSSNAIETTTVSNGQVGIFLENAPGSVVRENTVTESRQGIVVARSDDTTVEDTAVTDSPGGISIAESTAVSVLDTVATNTTSAVGIQNATATVERLDIGDSVAPNTTVSFEGRNVALNATETPMANPDTQALDRYVEIADLTEIERFDLEKTPYVDLEVHYEDDDVTGIVEEDVRLWRHDGDAWAELEGSSVDPDANVVAANLTEFSTVGAFRALEPAAVTVDDLETNEPVLEGETVTATATVTNAGELEGTRAVALEIDELGTVDSETVTLDAGETETVALEWETGEAGAGEYDLTVETGDDAAQAHVTVKTPPFFETRIDDAPASVDAGESIAIETTIANTGEVSDSQTIEFVVNGSTADTEAVDLAGGEARSLTFEYDTDETGIGTLVFALESEDDSDTADVVVEEPPEPAAFTVGIDAVPESVSAGQAISIDATVTNSGDLEGTQTVALEIGNETIDTTDVTLAGGDSETVALGWEPDETDIGNRTVTVSGDDDTASTVITVAEPPAEAAFDVTVDAAPETVTAGQTVAVDAAVTNDGDLEDTQSVALAVENETVATTDVTLAGGAGETITLEWQTDETDVGERNVTVATGDDSASATVSVEEASGPEPEPEPATFDVRLDAPDSVDAGEAIDLEATIENVGDEAGDQQLVLLVDGTSAETRTVALEAGASEAVSFTYATAEDDIGSLEVALESENDSDAAVVTVAEPPEPAAFAVDVDGPGSVVAGQTVAVDAAVTNDGELEDTQPVALAVGNETVATTDVTVAGGASETITLEWQTDESDSGEHDLTISSDDDSALTTVTVAEPPAEAFFDVALDAPETVEVGGEIDLELSVENIGEQNGTQTVAVFAGGTELETRTVDLAGGEAKSWTIPYNTDESDLGSLDLEFASENTTTGATTVVGHPATFAVDIADAPASVDAGETVSIDAVVTNDGGFEGAQPVALAVGNETVDAAEVTLAGGASETISLEWEPDGTDVGERNLTVSSDDDSASTTVTVAEPPAEAAFDVTIDDAPETVESGETIDIEATVENVGDRSATTDLEFVVDNETVETETVMLDEGSTETVTFSVDAADDADGERYEIAIRTADDEETVTVAVEDAGSSPPPWSPPSDPEPEPEPEPDPAAFEHSEVTVSETNLEPNEPVTVTATVTNVGGETGTQEATLRVDGEIVATANTTLQADESASITFEHAFADAGEYELEVGGEVRTVTVAEREPATFEFSNLSVNETEIASNESVSVTATLANVGDETGTQEATLRVDGEVVSAIDVTLEADERRSLEFTHTFDGAGEYTLVVGERELTVDVVNADDGMSEPDDGTPGFGLVAAIVALVAATALIRSRRRR